MFHRSRFVLRVLGARRSTLVWTAVAGVAAVASGARAFATLADASSSAARYGETVRVAVAARPVSAGEVVDADDVVLRDVPSALLPRAEAVRDAVGAVALAPLAEGEVVLASRLSSSLVPAGWRALAISPGGASSHPLVHAGDLVEVIDVAAEGVRVEGVVVSAVADGTVTVAVPAEAVARVAYAASAGTAVLALIAPAPRR